MNMPGFTAEASLANPTKPYRVVQRYSDRDGRASVIPALRVVSTQFCDNVMNACMYGNQYGCVLYARLCY
jgi:hypothetical protein